MTLTHPSGATAAHARPIGPADLRARGRRPHPAPRDPRQRHARGRRVPDHPRRADARRQRAPEPRDVRDDVDGAAGREADGRVLRQEHDRQGRVPADGGARDALRQHAQPALERARRRDRRPAARRPARARRRCSAGSRSSGAGRSAARPRASRPTGRTSSWASTSRSAGRSSRTTGTSRCGSCRWRATASRSRPRRPSKRCDENTIGVVAILGSTFDGSYEPVAEICAALDDLQERTGLDVPVHVDGASGAFVAPFIDPDLEWDFRLPRVASINTSGHKYGLVYPGVGWVVWRDAEALPGGPHLLGQLPRRQHADVRAELLAAGRPGRRAVLQLPAPRLRRLPARAGLRARRGDVAVGADRRARPVRAARPRATSCRCSRSRSTSDVDNFTVFDVSNALRERGWQVPAYTFPENRKDLAALRVVVRHGFGHDMADLLIDDIQRQLPRLQEQPAPVHDASTATAFSH